MKWVLLALTVWRGQTGMQTVRQLEFSLFDISLHKQDNQSDKSPSVQDVLNTARKDVSVIQAPDYNRFQCSFSHIFAGGYAAGYYSYKWAEVLSADAFDEFEQHGIFNESTGQKFLKCILSVGGVPTAATMFKDFKGRAPSITALLFQKSRYALQEKCKLICLEQCIISTNSITLTLNLMMNFQSAY